MSGKSGQLLTPSFYDDCEGIINVNGHPVLKLDTSKLSIQTTVDFGEFESVFGLPMSFLDDPTRWLGVCVEYDGRFMPLTTINRGGDDIYLTFGGLFSSSISDGGVLATVNILQNDKVVEFALHEI